MRTMNEGTGESFSREYKVNELSHSAAHLRAGHARVVPLSLQTGRVQEVELENFETPFVHGPLDDLGNVFDHFGVGRVEAVEPLAAVRAVRRDGGASRPLDDPVGVLLRDLRVLVGRERREPNSRLEPRRPDLVGEILHRSELGLERSPVAPRRHVAVVDHDGVARKHAGLPAERVDVVREVRGRDLLVKVVPRAPPDGRIDGRRPGRVGQGDSGEVVGHDLVLVVVRREKLDPESLGGRREGGGRGGGDLDAVVRRVDGDLRKLRVRRDDPELAPLRLESNDGGARSRAVCERAAGVAGAAPVRVAGGGDGRERVGLVVPSAPAGPSVVVETAGRALPAEVEAAGEDVGKSVARLGRGRDNGAGEAPGLKNTEKRR